MMIPTVHLNGSGATILLTQLRETYVAVKTAMDTLQSAAPHGRDYYVQGPDAYAAAAREHADRYARLNSVMMELVAIAEAVQEQKRSALRAPG